MARKLLGVTHKSHHCNPPISEHATPPRFVPPALRVSLEKRRQRTPPAPARANFTGSVFRHPRTADSAGGRGSGHRAKKRGGSKPQAAKHPPQSKPFLQPPPQPLPRDRSTPEKHRNFAHTSPERGSEARQNVRQLARDITVDIPRRIS